MFGAGHVRTAVDALRLQGAFAQMAWQAAIVVPLRLQRIAADALSARPAGAGEAARMVTEKLAAAARGAMAAQAQALRGGGPVRVALAAIGPARRAVRANAKRLAAR
jgi:hypothetical protein